MNNLGLINRPVKFQDLKAYILAIAILSLMITWGLELLTRELFRLAII